MQFLYFSLAVKKDGLVSHHFKTPVGLAPEIPAKVGLRRLSSHFPAEFYSVAATRQIRNAEQTRQQFADVAKHWEPAPSCGRRL